MFSDKCVNVFFQEWSPLFPVLHKATFLRTYEEYVAKPEDVVDPHKIAQLNLVFAIAGPSVDVADSALIELCEMQWRKAIEALCTTNTLETLQCLILAQLYCISKASYRALQHYKGIAVSLALRLGLHQQQKRFAFGASTMEQRKKVFWSLYTVDW